MKTRKFIVALILVLSVLPTNNVSIAQGSSLRKDEVILSIEAYDQAWNRKDSAAVERTLAGNYVYFSSEGSVLPRQEMLNFLRSPKYVLNAAERSELEVRRTNRTAVVSSRWKGNGIYDGKEFRDDQRCSLVLTQEGRQWKLLSEHCTQIVERH
jgi:ketosteroid isomerase-like protein